MSTVLSYVLWSRHDRTTVSFGANYTVVTSARFCESADANLRMDVVASDFFSTAFFEKKAGPSNAIIRCTRMEKKYFPLNYLWLWYRSLYKFIPVRRRIYRIRALR